MDVEAIRSRHREIVERHGAWVRHNIELAPGVLTMGADAPDGAKLRRVVQIVHDLLGGPPQGLRILDLASLEGQYAVEMAQFGASVVAIEGRDANLDKMRLAKEALGIDRMQIVKDDVRNLSREKYGEFDVVLCLGILYHLDVPDVFSFVERIFDVCRRFVIVDTRFALRPDERHEWRGATYWGAPYVEPPPEPTPDQKATSLLASLGNSRSTWFTRVSLCNLLARTGFSSVYECEIPAWGMSERRLMLVAMKGTRVRLSSMPDGVLNVSVHQKELPAPMPGPLRRMARKLPDPVKALLKQLAH